MRRVALVLLVLGCASLPWAQQVASGRSSSYLLGFPRAVCGAEVRDVAWSAGGRLVWIHRQWTAIDRTAFVRALAGEASPPSPREAGVAVEEQLLAYDVARDVATVVWRGSAEEFRLEGMAPLGSQRALALIRATKRDEPVRQVLLRVSARGERPAEIAAFEGSSAEILAHTGPGVPEPRVALVVRGETDRLLLASWSGVRPVRAVSGPVIARFEQGALWVATRPDGGWIRIDPASGQTTEQSPPPERPEELPLSWEVASPAKGPGSRPVKLLWLGQAGDDERAVGRVLLSGDAGDVAAVAPDHSAVVYVVNGVALLQELYPVSAELLRRQRQEAEEAAALSRAKQVGLALMMFAADHGGTLPQDADAILPYLRERETLEGFVFTGRGLKLGDLSDPGRVEIGYFPRSDGQRIVVYADGRVERLR